MRLSIDYQWKRALQFKKKTKKKNKKLNLKKIKLIRLQRSYVVYRSKLNITIKKYIQKKKGKERDSVLLLIYLEALILSVNLILYT